MYIYIYIYALCLGQHLVAHLLVFGSLYPYLETGCMGRMRARLRSVLVTGLIVICAIFLWMHSFHKHEDAVDVSLDDEVLKMRSKIQQEELTNKQRMNDLQMMRSQFNLLVQIVTNNASNSSLKREFPAIIMERGQNFSDELGSLHLPSIFTYMPHLIGHPDSLKPVYKLSRQRYGASIVIGIPTIKRDKVEYLTQTVGSLIQGMSVEEQNMCLIVVFVAEPWDKPYAVEVGQNLQKEFNQSIDNGLLEVISPPPEFYPDLDNLKLTFGDTKERVRWRTKQNVDFTFLMLYARTRGYYYVQLEDDVVAKPGFLSIMKTYADQQKDDGWILLEFSTLGFIGKLFKSSQLPMIVEFFLMFHKDKPIDWLLDHFLNVKVCSPEKDKKHCERMIAEVRKRFKPSLFQHIGTQSSLKGKTQKLKDKDFGKQAIYRAHVNPEATVESSIKAYQKYFMKKAYIGEDIFWGLTPVAGDTVEFKFEPPIHIASVLFRSGNIDHPGDIFTETIAEALPEDDNWVQIGEFNSDGIVQEEIAPTVGKIKIIRLRVLKQSSNWVILSEIHVVPRKEGAIEKTQVGITFGKEHT